MLERAVTVVLDPQAGRVNRGVQDREWRRRKEEGSNSRRQLAAAVGRRGRRGDSGGGLCGCTEEEHKVMTTAATGGVVNAAGQRLATVAGQWPRVGEGGDSGINVRSA
ncbi:hypothetical protein B296_00012882 [Ensete ventricosum]|uniref:Uncharacterized protein n=1 Tax=Ensete ventricosum TaxID=4639 RepID=A0A427APL2_ENSVE|nr:hypothetical protein B296_00012882 [Ensete ventricosum]